MNRVGFRFLCHTFWQFRSHAIFSVIFLIFFIRYVVEQQVCGLHCSAVTSEKCFLLYAGAFRKALHSPISMVFDQLLFSADIFLWWSVLMESLSFVLLLPSSMIRAEQMSEFNVVRAYLDEDFDTKAEFTVSESRNQCEKVEMFFFH